jgi:DNA-binding MarR family transcriptional regulator
MPDPDRSFELDDQLCFALYAASRAMTSQYRTLLDTMDLTYPQYLVLMILWAEGTCTVGALGTRLQLDSGTLSPLLKRLESKRIITRSRRADDQRSVEISLTPGGAALREQAVALPRHIAALIGDFDHLQLKRALRDLERLLHVK